MTPQKTNNQPQLFRNSLEAMLNDRHPLYKLANSIDWQRMEKELSPCYSSDMGRPGNATRLMVGLHYLKHAYNESDESIVERWVENPYNKYPLKLILLELKVIVWLSILHLKHCKVL